MCELLPRDGFGSAEANKKKWRLSPRLKSQQCFNKTIPFCSLKKKTKKTNKIKMKK